RTSYITRQMLSFHRSMEKPVATYMPDLMDDVIEMYGPVIGRKGITVRKDYEGGCVIAAIPAELTQVFANLLRNAIEAVELRGMIRIRVRHARDWRRPERSGVRVIVADSGRGIDAEVSSKIFDPFFTTKGESGTGLGLWVGLGIVQKREGAMRFKSSTKAGRSGTVFSVFLPSQTESIVVADSGKA
ncbi:MAG TPA: HAMP domain-containing sensor histidine kinase, partial [Terriglobales bacterium]